MSGLREVLAEVINRVKPNAKDREMVMSVVNKIKGNLEKEARARGLKVRVEIEGSLAKDTWVATDRDIDLFIIFPHGTSKEVVKEVGLELAKAGVGEGWRLGYAEHPYVEAFVGGYTVDIVPSVEIGEGERPVTAVDRTPLHTKFVLKKLDERMRDDVRLLKQFMKGIGVYGAELKVGGFSGYLCELLVINYGSFQGVLQEATKWKGRTVIDYMKYYREGEAEQVFDSPLVIIDPVDRRRNAAAAVSLQCYATFIAAANRFLEKPSVEYFFPVTEGVDIYKVLEKSKERGTSLVVIKTGCPKLPSDVLWGEIQKSLTKTVGLLERHDFRVLDQKAWSDEERHVIFMLELESRRLREGKIHLGPKAWYHEDVRKFLEKHLKGENVLAGPSIKEDRWYVEIKRKYKEVKELLGREFVKLQLSKDIMEEVKKGFRIYADEEIAELCTEEPRLINEINALTRKRPPWLN
ncbi:MAG: CCA tRNA nucleotidyltransferase [Candidatus Methanomethyliaceae archaeon]|nr:CCA tRNA nucleotidyltransferase [Candidatus Methanomethyliaceae archaeon]